MKTILITALLCTAGMLLPCAHAQQASTPVGQTAVREARRQFCVNQLRQLDGAKPQWALEKQQPEDATPPIADLALFIPGDKLPK